MEEDKLLTDYYSKYVGKYMKRFIWPFQEEHMMKISEFFQDGDGLAFFVASWIVEETLYEEDGTPYIEKYEETMTYDVEDSVIITDEPNLDDDERVASVLDDRYKKEWFNPYKKFV